MTKQMNTSLPTLPLTPQQETLHRMPRRPAIDPGQPFLQREARFWTSSSRIRRSATERQQKHSRFGVVSSRNFISILNRNKNRGSDVQEESCLVHGTENATFVHRRCTRRPSLVLISGQHTSLFSTISIQNFAPDKITDKYSGARKLKHEVLAEECDDHIVRITHGTSQGFHSGI